MAAYTSAAAGPTTVTGTYASPAIAQTGLTQPAYAATVEKTTTTPYIERHDPHDEWSARDLLLSTIPFMIVIAFRDTALSTALIVASAFSLYLIFKRTTVWYGFVRRQWPMYDVTSFVLFIILLGCSYREHNEIQEWCLVIAGGVFCVMALASIAVRRPFTSHYARYNANDAGGHGLWEVDADYRLLNDRSAGMWACVFGLICLLSIAPALATSFQWFGATGLNIFFNYIWPLGLLALALMAHQAGGRMYTRNAGQYTGANTVQTTTATAMPVASNMV